MYVAWWCNGYGVGLRLERSRVQLATVSLSGNHIRQVVYTHVPLSPSSIFDTSRGAAMSCDWEGNRRSGVALAMRHRLEWLIRIRVQGVSIREMNTQSTLLMGYGTLYLFRSYRTQFTVTKQNVARVIDAASGVLQN